MCASVSYSLDYTSMGTYSMQHRKGEREEDGEEEEEEESQSSGCLKKQFNFQSSILGNELPRRVSVRENEIALFMRPIRATERALLLLLLQ